jgi:tetratricopeptide (TPR) repeat protein
MNISDFQEEIFQFRKGVVITLFAIVWVCLGNPSDLPAAEGGLKCGPDSNWNEIARGIKAPVDLVSFLQRAVVECPGDLSILKTLGKTLIEQRRPEAAVNALRSGLIQTPDLVGVLLHAADAEITVRNYQQAFRYFQFAQTLEPSHPRIETLFKNLDGILPLSRPNSEEENLRLKTFFEGLAAKQQLERHPEDEAAKRTFANYLLLKARTLIESGKDEEADPIIRRAILLDPGYRAAREAMVNQIIKRGDYNFGGENYDKAIEDYQRGLQWLPNSIPVFLRIARALQQMPVKREEAHTTYLHAQELLKSHPNQGSERERTQWASIINEGLTFVDVKNPVYRKRAAGREIELAERLRDQGRMTEAMEAYHRALRWTPENALLHLSLGDKLRFVEDGWKEAIKRYESAILLLREAPPSDLNPNEIKTYLRHGERERARLIKSNTGTMAYIRTKFFLAMEKRRFELILFMVVFGSVLFFLWHSNKVGGED